MKSHSIHENLKVEGVGFQRVGHLHISYVDVFLALLFYQIGPADTQSRLRISSDLIELQWSSRGLIIVYIEKRHDCSPTEILYDCSGRSTWNQLLNVLGLTSRLVDQC